MDWFKFFPADFRDGCAEMTTEEVGAYILLLCRQWTRSDHRLPDDMASLAAIAGMTPRKFAASWNRSIGEKFQADEGGHFNARLEREHLAALRVSESKRANAQRRGSISNASAEQMQSISKPVSRDARLSSSSSLSSGSSEGGAGGRLLPDPIAEQEAQVLQVFEAAFGRMVMPGPATRYLRERFEQGGTVDQALAVIEHVRASGRHVGTPQDCFNSRIWNAVHAAPIEPRRRAPDGIPVTRTEREPEPPAVEIDPEAEEAWARIVEAAQIDPQSKDTWLRPTVGARLHHNEAGGTLLEVVVPSQAFHDWIRTRLSEPLAAASREQGIEKLACVVGRPARQESAVTA